MPYPCFTQKWSGLRWQVRTVLWVGLAVPPLALPDALSSAAWFVHEAASVAWACWCCRGPRGSRRWLQLALCALLFGDFAYALRQPATPRYPYNYLPDCAFVVAFAALAVLLLGQPRRLRAGTVAATCVAAALQVSFVLAPMGALACVPRAACAVALAYSVITAVVTALCLGLCLRLRARRALVAVHGPLLMLAADFVCRHAALSTRATLVSWGEMGWAMGLGLWVAPLASPPRRVRWPLGRASAPGLRPYLAPWLSVRVLLAGVVGATLPLAALLAVAAGSLHVDDGRRFGALLAACWAALLLGNVVAQQASRALRRTAGRSAGRRFAASRLHEVRTVLASRARDARWGQLAAATAHDLYGPAAALEAAAGALAATGGHLGPLLRQASRRVRELSAVLLEARRRALAGPASKSATRMPAAALPRELAPPPPRELAPPPPHPEPTAGRQLSAHPGRQRTGARPGQRVARGLRPARSVRLLPLLRTVLHEATLRAGVHAARLTLRLGSAAPERRRVALVGRAGEVHASVGPRESIGRRGLSAAACRDAWRQLRVAVPADALLVALGALLDNALQAQASSPTKAAGPVCVRVTLHRHVARLTVHDAGPGVPGALQARLGRRPVTSTKPDGNGLGVWRAARAARAWGGTLTLRSGRRRGAKATLTLPLPRRGPRVRHVVVDDDPLVRRALLLAARSSGEPLVACGSIEACWRLLERLYRRARAAAPGTLARRWATATVLAVDDALSGDDDGRVLRRALRGAGLPYVRRLGGDKLSPLATRGKVASAKRGSTDIDRPRLRTTDARILREEGAHRPRGHEDLI